MAQDPTEAFVLAVEGIRRLSPSHYEGLRQALEILSDATVYETLSAASSDDLFRFQGAGRRMTHLLKLVHECHTRAAVIEQKGRANGRASHSAAIS